MLRGTHGEKIVAAMDSAKLPNSDKSGFNYLIFKNH